MSKLTEIQVLHLINVPFCGSKDEVEIEFMSLNRFYQLGGKVGEKAVRSEAKLESKRFYL